MRIYWLLSRRQSIRDGENGEFHSFVKGGPILSGNIPVSVGESVARDQFAFADLNSAVSSLYPFVPITLTKLYRNVSAVPSGPVIAAVANSGYCWL